MNLQKLVEPMLPLRKDTHAHHAEGKTVYAHSYRPVGYYDSPESKAWEKEREGKIKVGHGIDYKYDVEQTSEVEAVRSGYGGRKEYQVTPNEGGYARETPGTKIWVSHSDIGGHHYPKE